MQPKVLARIAYKGLGTTLMLGLGLLPARDPELHPMVALLVPPGTIPLFRRGGLWLLAGAVSALLLGVMRLGSRRSMPGALLLLCLLGTVLYLGARALSSGRRRGAEPMSEPGPEPGPGPREVHV